MFRKNLSSLCLLMMSSWLSSCALNSETGNPNASGKLCKDSSGNAVNIEQIYGQWKKISGYIEGKDSDAQYRAVNFDTLVVEKGSQMCQVTTQNGEVQPLGQKKELDSNTSKVVYVTDDESYLANYSHDVTKKVLTLMYQKGTAGGARGDVLTYSFNADCSHPTMTFTYSADNTVLSSETFELQTKNVAQGTCSGTK